MAWPTNTNETARCDDCGGRAEVSHVSHGTFCGACADDRRHDARYGDDDE